MTKAKDPRESREKSIFLKTLSLAWELGYSIAVPLVVLAFSGRLLDKKYDSSPIFLLSGIILAISISGFLVFRKTKNILEDSEKDNKL